MWTCTGDAAPRHGVLGDCFVGAHAAVAGLPVLTRYPRRYRAYLPKLEIVSPG